MECRSMLRLGCVVLIGGLALAGARGAAQAAPTAGTFTMVNVLASDAKVWLPSTIVVHSGEQITLILDNKLDEAHGFAIDEYGIQVVVQPKSTQKVTFTAKPGVSRFYCQLHPAHIGGQVIVL
jgi:nitrosocyanin